MSQEILPGGNTDGAVRIDGVVHKRASPRTPTVHALLRHLEHVGVDGVPRALGFDEQGRQMLTYLPGEADDAANTVQAARAPPADLTWSGNRSRATAVT